MDYFLLASILTSTYSWAYIPDEFNGHGQLEQDVLVIIDIS